MNILERIIVQLVTFRESFAQRMTFELYLESVSDVSVRAYMCIKVLKTMLKMINRNSGNLLLGKKENKLK